MALPTHTISMWLFHAIPGISTECRSVLTHCICLFIHDSVTFDEIVRPNFCMYISPLIRKKSLEEMVFFRQKLFNLEQMILSEERGLAVSGYGWVLVVNVTVVPFSKVVGVELHT